MVRELHGSAAISDDEKDALEGDLFHAHGEEVRRRGRNAVARNADAKFRVGDKVITPLGGIKGRVVKVKPLAFTYEVKMEDSGSVYPFPEDHIKKV